MGFKTIYTVYEYKKIEISLLSTKHYLFKSLFFSLFSLLLSSSLLLPFPSTFYLSAFPPWIGIIPYSNLKLIVSFVQKSTFTIYITGTLKHVSSQENT